MQPFRLSVVLLKCVFYLSIFNGAPCINVLSFIRTFKVSGRIQSPMSLNKQRSSVYLSCLLLMDHDLLYYFRSELKLKV